MGRRQREKQLAFVEAGVSEARSLLTDAGLPEDKAAALAEEWVRRVVARFQRGYMYVPVRKTVDLPVRDAEIYRQYGLDGPNGARRFTRDRAEQLAEQHQLTIQQIYSIIRLQKHLELVDRQAPLDGPGFEHPRNPR